jgi:heterodisulfide reductase subunit B
MQYALFLGCTIPARSRNYELAARRVAEKLDIELVDVARFICCGFPLKSIEKQNAELLGAYNLCLAREKKLDLCALCSSCASALTEIVHRLAADDEARERVNRSLSKVGLHYEDGVRVRHFARILYEDTGVEKIRSRIEKDLGNLRIAVHYGCHYLKPSEIYEHFDSVEHPQSIDALVGLTGARVVNYSGKQRCCGGPVLPVDQNAAMSVTKDKLDAVKEAGADALCLVCPFCAVMYDGNQKSIEAEFGTHYDLPVFYLPQILGLAMGFDRKALGLNLNVVKNKELLKPFFE